jgi:hypothetical protein
MQIEKKKGRIRPERARDFGDTIVGKEKHIPRMFLSPLSHAMQSIPAPAYALLSVPSRRPIMHYPEQQKTGQRGAKSVCIHQCNRNAINSKASKQFTKTVI